MPDTQAMWSKTKTGGKAGFDKLWTWADKLGAPVNRLSNKLGSEAFWPTTLDKESDKAARILKSFCKDGFYTEEEARTEEGVPKGKQRVIKKIPSEVIRNAKGLCIFTTMRTGLWVSGSGGSGILVARMPNGEWSPPSGILMHTAGLGFLIGVDIYDCVIVINNDKALEAFTKVRCTLGGEVSAAAGPVGIGGVMDSEVHKRQAPIWTYIKSRGFYAGVQIDGTIVIERTDENERFYNQKMPVADILAGKVRHPPYELKGLMATLTAAEGGQVDENLLPEGPPPGDYEIEEDGHLFGVPDQADPDPYGVLALEKEGMQVREAGTKDLPTHEEFTFNPSPSSPIHNILNRRSTDSKDLNGIGGRGSWRVSSMSNASKMTDMATQTDEDELSQRSPHRDTFADAQSRRSSNSPSSSVGRLNTVSPTPIPDVGSIPNMTATAPPSLPPRLPPRTSATSPPLEPEKIQEDDEDADNEDDEDGAVIQQVHTATIPMSPGIVTQISKPKIVTVHKVAPPALPIRNAARERPATSDAGSETMGSQSPTRSFVSERKVDESSVEAAPRTESMSSISEARASPEERKDEEKPADTTRDVDPLDNPFIKESTVTPVVVRKDDDSFHKIALSKSTEDMRPSPVHEVKKATEEEKRSSRELAVNMAAKMRMGMDDNDDDDGNGIGSSTQKTSGGW